MAVRFRSLHTKSTETMWLWIWFLTIPTINNLLIRKMRSSNECQILCRDVFIRSKKKAYGSESKNMAASCWVTRWELEKQCKPLAFSSYTGRIGHCSLFALALSNTFGVMRSSNGCKAHKCAISRFSTTAPKDSTQ